jgi:large subunit ribosomal protein L23
MNTMVKPILTEKSLSYASRGFYTFAVHRDANKHQIASAIHSHYNVDVISVRTIMVHGKVRRVGKRMLPVRLTDWKKAIVTIGGGQTIDAFQVTGEEKGVTK